MRKTRKFLGALMAPALCLTMLPTTAQAVEPVDNWLDEGNYNTD